MEETNNKTKEQIEKLLELDIIQYKRISDKIFCNELLAKIYLKNASNSIKSILKSINEDFADENLRIYYLGQLKGLIISLYDINLYDSQTFIIKCNLIKEYKNLVIKND